MDPETLAAPCTNSMLEPFRRAIEAAVPGPSPPPPGLPDPNFNVANFTTYNKYHCNVDLVFSFHILFPLFVDCCMKYIKSHYKHQTTQSVLPPILHIFVYSD